MPRIHSVHRTTPVHQDRYFVDTNVWFWFTYCASKEISTEHSPMRYQLEKYPEFMEKVLDSGAKLYHCALVYTELANIIEKTEFDIYRENNPTTTINRKDFRSLEPEREKVMSEINLAWRTINGLSTCLDINLREDRVPSIHKLLSTTTLDSYDALYLGLMQQEGIEKIITDDNDFVSSTVADIYTANNRIL
ncbi:TPA: type II toxin-antitoxin system VapC family toxin [Vibrio parahaemolyticus]|uniref:type II toxin-antitoxin system VapC family toxin n=1 Tax=Vibrio TaxID=662 RepID=UPI001A1C602B|nr:PIN domain-containing protein [Vibrio sp. Vb2704]EIO4602069.1 type II toxin-antitoxin system VapC family toxin [Vibrio parahaemolyticus]HAS6089238.1 PIN domain-containing protein [Vibrio vulnificus]EJA7353317.1 type II toxin-antitoxin system VapC family toxin [Vibrio parahaemolyticus]EJC7006418.1 type II toxin-antitoxin system VapC family toxin [Vibrio parahaemolyticus]EJC7025152.1 type II toxin-antitoxin system VapC family toxin [Vibrio parahaemolyticus]